MDQRDYIVDIPGVADPNRDAEAGPSNADSDRSAGRPWIAVHFKCCHVYARLYRNHDHTAYVGHCPKCGTQTRAAIGPGGTDQRFFTAE